MGKVDLRAMLGKIEGPDADDKVPVVVPEMAERSRRVTDGSSGQRPARSPFERLKVVVR